MGSGRWTGDSFKRYSNTVGRSVDSSGVIKGNYSNQEMFKSRRINPLLNPKNVIRECVENDEHPNTIPVILALDVTGSMGQSAVEVAKKLNVIMTKLYDKLTDVEFMIMGIGDLNYDAAPIQISQFESDIRIAEQMDQVYFEFGGGGNMNESYSAAWYMGSRHTKLDCWERGAKGIIITIGDEMLNPYLPQKQLNNVTGDTVQADIDTKELYKEVSEKYDVYHIDVTHRSRSYEKEIQKSFSKVIGKNHFRNVTLDTITDELVNIIVTASKDNRGTLRTNNVNINSNGEISW